MEQIETTSYQEKKALLAVLAGNAIFGLSFLFSKLAMQVTLPTVLIAVRFSVAFLILNIIVLAGRIIKKKDGSPFIEFSLKGKPLKNILLMSLFQPVIYFVAENYGILYTSSAFAGIIIAVIPIAGIMMDVVIMKIKVSRKQALCALFSVFGVFLTTVGAKDMGFSVKGLIFLLIAVFSGAIFYVFGKKAKEDYNPLERTYVMFGVGSLVYICVCLVQCYGEYDKWVVSALVSPVFWTSIIYLSLVSSVIAFLLLHFGSNYISVSKVTLFANFTTVISIAAGVLILKEPFTIQQAIGALIILISVYAAR